MDAYRPPDFSVPKILPLAAIVADGPRTVMPAENAPAMMAGSYNLLA